MEPPQESQKQLQQTQATALKIPIHISKTYIQSHPEYTFIYGYDIVMHGINGMAWAFHGELNCFPVPTLIRYCPAQKIFFNDSNFNETAHTIDVWMAAIPDEFPIIVHPKIGRGCSQMYICAPKLYAYLMKRLDEIKYKNIEWKY